MAKVWLKNYKKSLYPEPNPKDSQKLKEYMKVVYEQKRFYADEEDEEDDEDEKSDSEEEEKKKSKEKHKKPIEEDKKLSGKTEHNKKVTPPTVRPAFKYLILEKGGYEADYVD